MKHKEDSSCGPQPTLRQRFFVPSDIKTTKVAIVYVLNRHHQGSKAKKRKENGVT